MDGVPFYVHAMKEPDYTMMLMATYGTTTRVGEQKQQHYRTDDGVKKVTKFQYPEVVHSHYSLRDMIDNHISYWTHSISMEETWMMMRWANRVFCFLVAVTMVNVQNAAAYFFNKSKLDALTSRQLIAKELIFNCHLVQEEQQKKRPRHGSLEHSLTMVPMNKQFVQGRLVPCKTKYGKWKCTDCKKFVRSYCTCMPGLMFCVHCFGNHRAECTMAGTTNTQFGVMSL